MYKLRTLIFFSGYNNGTISINRKVLAYFTAYSIYERSYFVSDIPGAKITHLNYAYANVGANGRITVGDPYSDTGKDFIDKNSDQPSRGNFNQLIKLKAEYPHLRTLISVGGWVIDCALF